MSIRIHKLEGFGMIGEGEIQCGEGAWLRRNSAFKYVSVGVVAGAAAGVGAHR